MLNLKLKSTPKTINGIPLPTWTDAASVTTYLTSLAAIVVAIITLVHPGYQEPQFVQGLVPSVAFLVAGAAQIFNAVTHRNATAQLIKAGYAPDGHSAS